MPPPPNPRLISAREAAQRLGEFDTVIDARSPTEYAEDHLPGAHNWPVLDDDERQAVGTEYKQISSFDARKHGAALVARRIAEHIERHVADKPRDWQPLVYCWRGGQRSGTLAWFLAQIGFRTLQLEGGYKAFRQRVREQLQELPQSLQMVVVAGRTGSGKTRLLQALQAHGAQVLDLEALARHRGSVLGALPDEPQPNQKQFEMQLWEQLSRLNPERPVFVESESRKIGQRHLPDALLQRMRDQGRCVLLEMPDEARVQLLLQEYGFFADRVEAFCELLQALVELRGRERVERWQQMARAGLWAEVFGELMRDHYDPLYARSMDRNYAGIGSALVLPVADGQEKTLRLAAQGLIKSLEG